MLVRAVERRAIPKTDSDWRRLLMGGSLSSKAGVDVNEGTALTLATVWACVRVIAESLGQLPLVLYEVDERSKKRALKHPLYRLLHDVANEETTSLELREWIGASLALRGNALLVKERSRGGDLIGLWPLPWSQIEVKRTADQVLRFIWHPSSAPTLVFLLRDVWYMRGLSFDGLTGVSPIALARDALGHALAAQEFASRFFSNGATVGGVLEHPGKLSPEATGRLKASWEEFHGSLSNAHKTAVFEEGMKWHQIGIAPEDAQLLETRKFSRSEVASIWRVPPHMVGDLEKATFTNIEHQGQEFVVHTLMPYLRRVEQAAHRDLLTEDERGRLLVKFIVDGFLRGDSAARSAFYMAGITSGWLTRNEVRAKEDLDAIEGLDEPLEPLNMVPAGSQPTPAPTPKMPMPRGVVTPVERRAAARRRRIAEAAVPFFRDAARRIGRAERREVEKVAASKLTDASIDEFLAEIASLYGDGGALRDAIEQGISPPIDSLYRQSFDEAASEIERETDTSGLDELVTGLVTAFVARHAGASESEIGAAARAGAEDPKAAIAKLFGGWEDTRPDRIAKRETVKTSRAAAKQAYARSGVRFLKWVASGENCPWCVSLDGRTVGIEQDFVAAGEEFNAEDRPPLVVSGPVSHPPLHRGCDCSIAPA